ncbi:hypothetical protein [Methanosarcina mazei]|jgi:membrane protein YdbS with pleckstrin-like domain|uniref:Uncharacterized protein n=7 Tax=Methanosarcina mazei TaxID=2209 RepID=A0A0F8LT59_METMZ|nr:hypothetical protein [Methanosarcina mazei]AAM32025.1 conserved protein [Methanosarcina mazei Go1]KKG02922.1 hypothetical protein DU47_14825 [Methanosarcina mazei]KKG28059.1 hypothetical protein DU49_13895 [Methanosarcina mazei]KKG33745.1 hypothetical protein DU30_14445 [Methanosarcina mazei]KKG36424.1 hypothetical protein DU52_16575 [Methanosarcina mazei]
MVNFESKDKNRAVFLLSVATSVVLMSLFLLGTLLANIYSGETSYTLVDVVMGCIFVFIITIIISLSLWPRVLDWLENREQVKKSEL